MIKAHIYGVSRCVRHHAVSCSLYQSLQAYYEKGAIISYIQTGKLGFREIKQFTQITQFVSGIVPVHTILLTTLLFSKAKMIPLG